MGENMLSYKKIAKDYGETAATQAKTFSKLCIQQCKQENRIIFLLRFKEENLTPTFLKLKLNHIIFNCEDLGRKFGECILKKFVHSTLNLLITDTTKNL